MQLAASSQEFVSIFVRTNGVVAHFLKHPEQAFAYKFLFYKKLYLLFPSLHFFGGIVIPFASNICTCLFIMPKADRSFYLE